MSIHRGEHLVYRFICLTRWYAPLDWLAHHRPFGRCVWTHRAAWAVQRRQNNLWNRYAQRCRERDL